jgi:hypothetical protein
MSSINDFKGTAFSALNFIEDGVNFIEDDVNFIEDGM